MKQIAVIGGGTMGNGIAHVFAQFGYQVNLIDVSEAALEKAIATITKNLDRQVAKGSLTEAEKGQTLANLSTLRLGLSIHRKICSHQIPHKPYTYAPFTVPHSTLKDTLFSVRSKLTA